MKNKLSDLNDHLFAQLERLSDETLTIDQIEHEAKRCDAMVSIADQVLRIAGVQIQAAKIAQDCGGNAVAYLPAPTVLDAPTPPKLAIAGTSPARKLSPFPPFKGSSK